MKTKIEVHEFTAPADWASYLINADNSAITDEDRAACDRWLEWVGMGSPVDVTENTDFSRSFDGDCIAYPDGDHVMQEIATYTFHKRVETDAAQETQAHKWQVFSLDVWGHEPGGPDCDCGADGTPDADVCEGYDINNWFSVGSVTLYDDASDADVLRALSGHLRTTEGLEVEDYQNGTMRILDAKTHKPVFDLQIVEGHGRAMRVGGDPHLQPCEIACKQRSSSMEALKQLIDTLNTLTDGELYLGDMAGKDYVVDDATGPVFVTGSLEFVCGYLTGRIDATGENK